MKNKKNIKTIPVVAISTFAGKKWLGESSYLGKDDLKKKKAAFHLMKRLLDTISVM